MGKAARVKRDLREAGPLPARFDFGSHFLAGPAAQRAPEAPESANDEQQED